MPASPDQVYLTAGAAAGLAISICAVTEPGDEVVVRLDGIWIQYGETGVGIEPYLGKTEIR